MGLLNWKAGLLAGTALAGLAMSGPANASLMVFRSFTASGEAVSTDGCGSLAASCSLHNTIPAGSNYRRGLALQLDVRLDDKPKRHDPDGGRPRHRTGLHAIGR